MSTPAPITLRKRARRSKVTGSRHWTSACGRYRVHAQELVKPVRFKAYWLDGDTWRPVGDLRSLGHLSKAAAERACVRHARAAQEAT